MSEDRDNAASRRAINETARDHYNFVKKADPTYTFDQAKHRTQEARRKGDMKRENGNR